MTDQSKFKVTSDLQYVEKGSEIHRAIKRKSQEMKSQAKMVKQTFIRDLTGLKQKFDNLKTEDDDENIMRDKLKHFVDTKCKDSSEKLQKMMGDQDSSEKISFAKISEAFIVDIEFQELEKIQRIEYIKYFELQVRAAVDKTD